MAVRVHAEYDAEHGVTLVYTVGSIDTVADCRAWLDQYLEIASREDKFAYWIGVLSMCSVNPELAPMWLRHLNAFADVWWGAGVIVNADSVTALLPRMPELILPDIPTALTALKRMRDTRHPRPRPPKRKTVTYPT